MNWDRIEGDWKKWSSKAAKGDPLFPLVLLGLIAVIGIVAGALMTPRQTRVSRHHWKR